MNLMNIGDGLIKISFIRNTHNLNIWISQDLALSSMSAACIVIQSTRSVIYKYKLQIINEKEPVVWVRVASYNCAMRALSPVKALYLRAVFVGLDSINAHLYCYTACSCYTAGSCLKISMSYYCSVCNLY